MNGNERGFAVDRDNGKLLGVCAGIGNRIGVDATFVRVAFVLAAIVVTLKWTLAAYGVLFLVGKARTYAGRVPARAATRTVSRAEQRERMRNLDLRMQAIETYVTSSNSSLAREIEDLR
jgi:phage shock protein C